MAGTLIDYRVEKGVAIFELNDPPANTYTYEMNRELDDCILRARMDDEVHVIVIRGAGEKFFSAGANIKMLNEVDPTFKYYFCLHANETLSRLEQTPKLVIAAITSFGVCSRRSIVSFACRQKLYLNDGVTSDSILILAPAEKNFSPAPRMTITCTSSSMRASRMRASSSLFISYV